MEPDKPDYCYRHLSVRDYLRELSKPKVPHDSNSFECDNILAHLRESKLLPADVLILVLEHKIASIPNGNSATTFWLIDGFPRNMETALAIKKKVDILAT